LPVRPSVLRLARQPSQQLDGVLAEVVVIFLIAILIVAAIAWRSWK